MPRKPRIDAPGLVYHVMARGIDRSDIFRDDIDREGFLARLGEVVTQTGTLMYAFCLMPNHFHLLLRRAKTPIATVMRRLLTGYAICFNKRHDRVGYVFQNRYKATICQDDPYLLELIRYIGLNPQRAGLVSGMAELDSFPFASHSLVVGKRHRSFFEPDLILCNFGGTEKQARNYYRAFVRDGINMGKRPEFAGGGLKRSLGYPKSYPKKKQAYDDRILGEGSFVEEILAGAELSTATNYSSKEPDEILAEVANACRITLAELLGATKKKEVASARALLAYRLSKETGATASAIARQLGVTRSAAFKMIKRGDQMGKHE